MRVKIVHRPSGLLNGREWPEVGESLDVLDVVGEGLIAGGFAEQVAPLKARKPKVEKRPAPSEGVETR